MVVHSGDVGQTRNCYGIQLEVLTHSGSEPFDGRISMKFHSQQIKGHCQVQYVPCLQVPLRFAQCLAIVVVKTWLIFCSPDLVKGQLNEMRVQTTCFRSPFEIPSIGHYNPVDSECFLTAKVGAASVRGSVVLRVRLYGHVPWIRSASVTSLTDAPTDHWHAPIAPTYCSSLRLIVRCHLTNFPDRIALQPVFFVSQASQATGRMRRHLPTKLIWYFKHWQMLQRSCSSHQIMLGTSSGKGRDSPMKQVGTLAQEGRGEFLSFRFGPRDPVKTRNTIVGVA